MGIWETEEMEEAARNQQWEELNQESGYTYSDYQINDIDFHGNLAIESLRKAISDLGEATKLIYGSGIDKDIAGYIAELETVEENVENLLDDIKKGVIA